MTFDEQAATMDHKSVAALLASHQQLVARVEQLMRQLEWFKRQMFGSRSERRLVDADGRQLYLGEWSQAESEVQPEITVAAHQRRSLRPPEEETQGDGDLRFDPSVPVEEIRLPSPVVDVEHEVISEKVTYRLAQRPVSYVVLKYIRPVVKRKDDGSVISAPAPGAVLGKSLADVSLLACMAVDKFRYHLPLYRQHQRMEAAGVRLARSTLTGLLHRTADLLEPIYEAQLASVLGSGVLAMDETPIKAGRKQQGGRGAMKTGYFWPIFGDHDEVVFPFSPSRSGEILRDLLGGYEGVLLSDGYKAYETFAARIEKIVHAQCWSHLRRRFLEAETIEPELTAVALDLIRRLYEEEAQLWERWIEDTKRVELRARQCKPIVDEFFAWLKDVLEKRVLLPSNPFTEAAGYGLAREGALRVFLENPAVPIDTNHLERQIRPIAVGRKNWLFCWTEVGAECVGIFQSLISTCRLQGVDPYTYLVDVLQRVDDHPMADVAALTPRIWKDRFAGDPRRSAIDRDVKHAPP